MAGYEAILNRAKTEARSALRTLQLTHTGTATCDAEETDDALVIRFEGNSYFVVMTGGFDDGQSWQPRNAAVFRVDNTDTKDVSPAPVGKAYYKDGGWIANKS